jgi:hypothetical protein
MRVQITVASEQPIVVIEARPLDTARFIDSAEQRTSFHGP